MKVLLIALGSRGDIEPFLALGQMLKKHDHEVMGVFPAQFEKDTKALGLISQPFSAEFLNIAQTESCKKILAGSGSFVQRLMAYWHVIKALKKAIRATAVHERAMIEQFKPDKVIFNALCYFSMYWSYFHPKQAIQVLSFPFIVHADKAHHFLTMRGTGDRGPRMNLLSYTIMNALKINQIQKIGQRFPLSTLYKSVSNKKLKHHFLHTLPSWYPISKHIFTKPDVWGDHVQITGYLEREPPTEWNMSDDLKQFLARFDKIIMVSFGSMTNDKPEHFTQMILQLAQKHAWAVIFNTASGGFNATGAYPDHIRFVEYIPYKLILPRIYLVIHHGGTGTTHLSIKYGCVSIVIPHILDQFFWADTIHQKKLGPKGIPIFKLTSASLETAILEALASREYKINAEQIALQMQSEPVYSELIQMITQVV